MPEIDLDLTQPYDPDLHDHLSKAAASAFAAWTTANQRHVAYLEAYHDVIPWEPLDAATPAVPVDRSRRFSSVSVRFTVEEFYRLCDEAEQSATTSSVVALVREKALR